MKLRENFTTKLIAVLLYCSSIITPPISTLYANSRSSLAAHPAAHTCSCTMCSSGASGHHCKCCTLGSTCTCNLSSNDQDYLLFPGETKPGLLCFLNELIVPLQCTPLYISPPHLTSMPFLSVPTPPPKA